MGGGGGGKEANSAKKSVPKNVDTDWIIIICVCYTMRMQSCIVLKIYIVLLSIK